MRAASSRSVTASSAKTERKPPRIDARDAGASDGTTYKYSRGRTCRPTGLEADSEDVAHRNVTPDGTMDRFPDTDASKATTAQSYRHLDAEQRLRTKLDDVTHVLTGLLEPLEAQKGRLLPTRSVLELIKLLQDPEMLQVVKLDGERRRIETEMKQVLVQQLGRCEVTGSETFDVSLAVLVYFLSSHAATKCWFDDHELLDVVVYALKRAIVREGANEHETQVTQQAKMEANESVSTFPAAVEVENCLKRKKRSKTLKDAATVKAAAAGETAACGKLVATTTLAVSTAQILDESCWVQLDALLHDHESFYVEGKLHVSVVSALSAALLSLLQVGEVLSSLTPGMNQQYQQRSCDASSYDAAENACQRMRARKSQLVRNGGVYALMRDLARKVHNLTATVPLTRVGAITMECVELLQRIKTLLCVFDQVTFLTSDVQRYISEKRAIFALSLKLIHLLSEMSWGTRAQGRWKAEPTRMSLTMETLLSALRVLINLTHHNLEAAQHIFALDGMQLLAASFSKLLGFVEGAKKHPLQLSAARKWEFDACLLLLSVMVNCIEFSEDNRAALAGVSLTHVGQTVSTMKVTTGILKM
ncbi:unnamed protein product [Hyaloperonospora brassicae]|uniref:Wings apart-like protein C-terminal domain-containing protein n=1 Tax=Hyaloperonospora brassicae TaxID=162125 RepID=A0AAV0V193_HYABA|nr:unnamed protein product [Hyaloperonospora brassicae]